MARVVAGFSGVIHEDQVGLGSNLLDAGHARTVEVRLFDLRTNCVRLILQVSSPQRARPRVATVSLPWG
jgi:hypothetical protein